MTMTSGLDLVRPLAEGTVLFRLIKPFAGYCIGTLIRMPKWQYTDITEYIRPVSIVDLVRIRPNMYKHLSRCEAIMTALDNDIIIYESN